MDAKEKAESLQKLNGPETWPSEKSLVIKSNSYPKIVSRKQSFTDKIDDWLNEKKRTLETFRTTYDLLNMLKRTPKGRKSINNYSPKIYHRNKWCGQQRLMSGKEKVQIIPLYDYNLDDSSQMSNGYLKHVKM